MKQKKQGVSVCPPAGHNEGCCLALRRADGLTDTLQTELRNMFVTEDSDQHLSEPPSI